MTPEVVMAAGYALALSLGAFVLEWLSSHSHKRALRFRTFGFSYDEQHDKWMCPEDQALWPHEYDHERRLVRYKAKSHVCNSCWAKERCTDSADGREITRPLDPWPHSEAGRFHRAIALMMTGLAAFIALAELLRNHTPAAAALLLAALAVSILSLRWLLRDFRLHPSNAPPPTTAQGLGLVAAGADGVSPRSRWASQNRIKEIE